MTAAASASFAEAWNSPSAATTFARRSRPALALGAPPPPPPLALGLGLAGHRPLHAGRDLDVLHLDHAHLDAPGGGLLVDDLLQDLVDLVAVGQELVQRVLAEDAAQRRLRDLRRG